MPRIGFPAFAPGLLISAVLALRPLAAHPHEMPTYHPPAAQGWRLKVTTDRFSGEVRCRLQAEGMRMAHGAVAFDIGRHADVLNAWFRIDGGAPARWRDMLPELARQRIRIDGRDLAVPTDGLVWFPREMLGTARSIAIQPGFGRRAKTFRLDGFSAAYDRALAAGCPPAEQPAQ